MKTIVCNFNLFDLHQNIHLADESGETELIGISNINDLGTMIAELCSKYKVNDVHLYGNEDYAVEISNKITTYNYNSHLIRIEVN